MSKRVPLKDSIAALEARTNHSPLFMAVHNRILRILKMHGKTIRQKVTLLKKYGACGDKSVALMNFIIAAEQLERGEKVSLL